MEDNIEVKKIKGVGGLEDLSDDELLMMLSTISQRYVVFYNAINKWNGRKDSKVSVIRKKYLIGDATAMKIRLMSCKDVIYAECARRGLKYANLGHNIKDGDRWMDED